MNLAKYLPPSITGYFPGSIRKAIRSSNLYIKHKCELDNLYHCCTHKSASQWIRSLFSDRRITYRYSGLEPFNYYSEWMEGTDPRPTNERYFNDRPFPKNTVATPVYLGYECFKSIPKPPEWRAFFVLRDPRDIIISWYFYHKHGNHVPSEGGDKIEAKLNQVSITEGLCFCIDYLSRFGLFDMQRSWVRVDHPDVKVFKYEDLTGSNQLDYVIKLFDHCLIPIPRGEVRDLLYKHSFKRKAGRDSTREDRSSHYRKGKAGNWRDHFNDKMKNHFLEVTDGLVDELEYSWH